MNYKEKHKKMWKWLSEHPDKDKKDFFDEMGIPVSDRPLCLCYACESAYQKSGQHSCSFCPIILFKAQREIQMEYIIQDFQKAPCNIQGSIFAIWERSNKLNKEIATKARIAAAKAMIDLEWEEEDDKKHI